MARFAAVPNEVFYALEHGEITLTMFNVLCILHKQADWSTGVVAFTCARTIADKLCGQFAVRTIQDSLNHLIKAGYIVSGQVPGSKLNYPVGLSNYCALTGVQKGVVLNPCEIKDWRTSQVLRPGGLRAEDSSDDSEVSATHHSIQEPTSVTTTSSKSKNSLSLSLARFLQTEKAGDGETPNPQDRTEPQRSCETPLDVYEANEADDNINRKFARSVAAQVVENLLGDTYTRRHEEKTLPKFLQSFPISLETDAQCLIEFNRMSMFIDWVISQPKLNAKFTSVDDFFFHWLNKSGNERGLRNQFEALRRAAAKDDPEERKHVFEAMKRVEHSP